ncbi:hypothetical protein B296_00049108, partial [Ensete ventricosum]
FTSIVLIMSARLSRTIYVGNLPIDIRESEVEDLFYKYGHIVEIQLKNPPRPPGYCFVEIVVSIFLGFTPLTSQDHMRKAGDVCFAQVFRDGDGRS